MRWEGGRRVVLEFVVLSAMKTEIGPTVSYNCSTCLTRIVTDLHARCRPLPRTAESGAIGRLREGADGNRSPWVQRLIKGVACSAHRGSRP